MRVFGYFALTICMCASLLAQQQEVGLTLGALVSQDRADSQTRLTLGSGIALQANYGYRLVNAGVAALYGEIHFLANPLRDITSVNLALTRNVATLYVTPGVRLKLFPGARISPYGVVGGGYAWYEQSTDLLNGAKNPATRELSRGALDYGGGVDVRFWRFIGLRGEIRDFYTGSPAYNLADIRGGQHNIVAGGGIVLRLP